MKTNIQYLLITILSFALANSTVAQMPDHATPNSFTANVPRANVPKFDYGTAERVSFSLKNTLGYHCMFRAEGPNMAYGFSMNRNETVPKNWPVSSKLYFSKNGETNDHYILTISADDAGKTVNTETPKPASLANLPTVSFRLRNNGLLPRKVAVISYEPGQDGNSSSFFILGPYSSSKQRFPIGTKIYLADNAQVDIVMSGKRLDSSKPFLTVTKEDAGKTFNIAD